MRVASMSTDPPGVPQRSDTMTAYAVDAEQIAAASAQACTTASTIRTEVDAMMAQLLALQDSWTGGAQVNFQATITQWQGIQAQTHDALDAIST